VEEKHDSFRVGVDLVRVADVAETVAHFGDRYLRRIYTEHELASCTGVPEVAAASLAARFAAKEAVLKVLRPAGARPDWRDIEVHRDEVGACEICLTSSAARLAAEAGVTQLAVSLTHEHELAMAVVVAAVSRREVRVA